jgi:hypothetical protein
MPTSYDDPTDDEDWYDDESADEAESDAAGSCPECNGPVYEFTDKCPACGYYLTESDRRRIWSGKSRPIWILVTATVILMILLFGMLTLRF